MIPPESNDNDFDAIANDLLDTTPEANVPENLTSEQYRRLADYQLIDALLTELFHEDPAQLESCIDRAIRAIQTDADNDVPRWPIFGLLGNGYHGAIQYLPQQVFLSYLIGGIFTGLLILFASLVTVTHSTPLARKAEPTIPWMVQSDVEFVGRVTDMVDVRWADPNTATEHGMRVPRGRKYTLVSGLMEITYDSGARVILQGPVTYEVDSRDSGFLSVGKLTAKFEKKEEGRQEREKKAVSDRQLAASATNPKSQVSNSQISDPQSLTPVFAVHTPAAVITDLGTEFGVEVAKDGTTTSHVFRGLVQVETVTVAGVAEGESQILKENQSVSVRKKVTGSTEEKQMTVFATSTEAAGFIREIFHQEAPKPTIKSFDLVDVVAGGDGFSGKRNAGIDVTTGRRATAVDYIDSSAVGSARFPFPPGDGKYHPVSDMPFVDGVFIPDSGHGPVRTDSAGHVFEDCPTTFNRTAHYLWAGSGAVPTLGTTSRTTLGNIDYAQKDRCYLFMHSNKGVTFNLEAIRKAHPNVTIRRFLAVLGNAAEGSADVWIVIDGKERFCRREISNRFVAMPVDVPIRKTDHFLTLIATDGGDDIHSDWIMLGDPRLELVAPNDTQVRSQSHPQLGKESQ